MRCIQPTDYEVLEEMKTEEGEGELVSLMLSSRRIKEIVKAHVEQTRGRKVDEIELVMGVEVKGYGMAERDETVCKGIRVVLGRKIEGEREE